MTRRRSRIGFALAALAAAGCFDAEPTAVKGGGGVETTEGNLANASSLVAPAGARVSLIPADFDPLKDTLPGSLTVLTDAKGKYVFNGLAPGRYNLEAYLPSAGTRCFRPGVVIAKGDRSIPETDTLAPPGRLHLAWDGGRRGMLTQKGRLFRVDLAAVGGDSGGITLDSLPAGLLPPFTYLAAPDSAPRLLTDSVRIVPGKLDTMPVYGQWAHSALVILDTTSLTPDSLSGYRMLVRLARPEFPFEQVSRGGADIRFTNVEGEVLRHTVESWDSAAGHAEIWVQLPTAPGGAFGTLRMDWGNPAAVSSSGSVFDSATGYAGLWHLNEKTSGGEDILQDAGPFALHTSAAGLLPVTQGVIGVAQQFDGIGAYVSAADTEPMRTPAYLCVSAWIVADTAGMLGKTPAGAPQLTYTILSDWEESDSTGFILSYLPDYDVLRLTLGFGGKTSRVEAVLLETPEVTWHQLGATYNGSEAGIWVDGKEVANWYAGPGDLPLPSRQYLIGARATAGPDAAKTDFFRGRIDEARFFRSVPKRAWLNLDFTTQQPGSTRLRFQKLR